MYKKHLDPLFQAIFDHPLIGAAVTDSEYRFLSVNKTFCKMLGYEESEFIGKTPQDFTHQDDLEKTKKLHSKISISANGSAEYEKRFISKDGQSHWTKVILRRIQDPQNITQYLNIALIEDIAPAKASQAKAEFDQMQLSAILDTSMFGVWCVDTNWQITYSNRALREMLGYSTQQMLNLNLRDLTHPEDLVDTNSKFDQTRPGENYQAKRRYLKQDGTYLWTQLTVSKFPKNDLKLYGLAVVEDISAQILNQKIIEEQQVKMISSAKMAALGEMAGGIAHEINNPLAVIIGKADQIRRKLDDPTPNISEIKNDLNKVKSTVGRISSIIKGLRIFSRDADKDPWITTSIQDIVRDTIALCQEKFKAHSIGIILNIEKDLFINCRPTQIEQILINLLSNSLDAIDSLQDKWIHLEAKKLNHKIQIIVTDSGHGIESSVVQKMMQPFFTTKPIGRGTGLGLSISTGIAQEHQGHLYYDHQSQNTRFILELPSCDAARKPA